MTTRQKRCPHCGRVLSLTQFYKSAAASDGCQPWCKACQRQRRSDSYRSLQGRAAFLFYAARQRANQKGKTFALDLSWVEAKLKSGKCEATGIEFELGLQEENWKSHPYSPSLDRIDNNKGYTPENTQAVCWAVNAARHQYNDEVFDNICRARVAVLDRGRTRIDVTEGLSDSGAVPDGSTRLKEKNHDIAL